MEKCVRIQMEFNDRIIFLEGEDPEKWIQAIRKQGELAFDQKFKFPDLKWRRVEKNLSLKDGDIWFDIVCKECGSKCRIAGLFITCDSCGKRYEIRYRIIS